MKRRVGGFQSRTVLYEKTRELYLIKNYKESAGEKNKVDFFLI